MLNQLGCTFLVLLTLGIPAVASDSKTLPPCASRLQCEIAQQGRASCSLQQFQSSRCSGLLAATVMTWSAVTATADRTLTEEIVHQERREYPSRESQGIAAAQAIAAEPFEMVLRPGQDIEVRVALLGAADNLLWSSRLFLLSDETGFRIFPNHPVMEHADTTHHVAFEKSEP